MPRLLPVFVLALTLAACGGGGDTITEDDDTPETVDAPDPTADVTFSDLVEGQSMVLMPTDGPVVCFRFTGPWRFEVYDPDLMGWFAGNYDDVSDTPGEPGTTGTLSFTEDPANDPDEAEFVVDLTFASGTDGTHEWAYFEDGAEILSDEGDFEIVEGHIDEADC